MLRKKMNKSLTLVFFFEVIVYLNTETLILGINRETMVYQSRCEFKRWETTKQSGFIGFYFIFFVRKSNAA